MLQVKMEGKMEAVRMDEGQKIGRKPRQEKNEKKR